MMEMLPNGGKLGMMSIINAGNMREAVAGFKAYIEANGGGKYNIVANEDDGGDAQKAAQVTAAIIAANPDIAGLAGFDSESGAGIVTALREAGKNPGDIKVTAMEQTPDFFKTAKEGWVDGIVVQNRELFIYYAVKMLHDYNTNTLKSAGLDVSRRRPSDSGHRRHRRAARHQGQCRQGADRAQREVGIDDSGEALTNSSLWPPAGYSLPPEADFEPTSRFVTDVQLLRNSNAAEDT